MSYAELETKFVSRLQELCRTNPKAVALPEFEDQRVAKAAAFLLNSGSVTNVHTLTSPDASARAWKAAGISTPLPDSVICTPAAEIDTEDASPIVAAGMLLDQGKVDVALAGAQVTTAEVIRAAISQVGLAEGCRTISGAFFMDREATDETILFADCGVVIEPKPSQLLDIGRESIRTWRQIMTQVDPVVAYLSFSTKGSAQSPSAERAAQAAEALRQEFPDVAIDGELQFDAAYDREVAMRKCPDSPASGKANIFIFPDLNAGNIAYKIAQRLGGFGAFGPILQGAARPYSDLSRGASVGDIIASAYINMLRA